MENVFVKNPFLTEIRIYLPPNFKDESKDHTMENNSSNNKTVRIILIILLAVVVGYAVYTRNEYTKLTTVFTEEKAAFTADLKDMVAKYDEAIAQKTTISEALMTEKQKIEDLQAEVTSMKASNYQLIRGYKRKAAKMQAANKRLFFVNDSLTAANNSLTTDLGAATAQISKQIAANDALTSNNANLSNQVALGSRLQIMNTKVSAMHKRRSGKMTKTSRARRTDVFITNFTIAKNEIATEGDRAVVVQILNTAGDVLTEDTMSVAYANNPVAVVSVAAIDSDVLQKGTHTVRVFIEKRPVGVAQVILK